MLPLQYPGPKNLKRGALVDEVSLRMVWLGN